MFSPKNVDGSFHTNDKFTKIYFKLKTDKVWFEFDNIFSQKDYIDVYKSSSVKTQTEVLQTLVESLVREIGIFGHYVCITVPGDGHKIIPVKRHDKFPDDATLVPSFATNPETSNADDANVAIVPDKCVDDNVPEITQTSVNTTIDVADAASVPPTEELTVGLCHGELEKDTFLTHYMMRKAAINSHLESQPCKECANKKEIPYDIIIDLRLSCLPNNGDMVRKTNALLEYYDISDVSLLKNLLSREPSKENDDKIKKMIDFRSIIPIATRGPLPITEFEKYRKGYLFELFARDMPRFNNLHLEMKENSSLFDLVRVIKETEVHHDDIHLMIDNFVKNGVFNNKVGVLQVLMKALI